MLIFVFKVERRNKKKMEEKQRKRKVEEAFNSDPDEVISALNEFSEKYTEEANHIKENHPAFFANVDAALSDKHWDREYIKISNLMMKNLSIRLYIRH